VSSSAGDDTEWPGTPDEIYYPPLVALLFAATWLVMHRVLAWLAREHPTPYGQIGMAERLSCDLSVFARASSL